MSEGTSESSTYRIDGVTYRLVERLGWQQCQWLGQSVFKGVALHAFNPAVLHDVIRLQGPVAMAICCLKDDETRQQQAKLAWTDLMARAEAFQAEVSPDEVLAFEVPFYRRCTPAVVAMLIEGQQLQAMYDEPPLTAPPSPVPGPSGSSAVSSSLAEGTLPESAPSSATGDQPNLRPISGDVLSDRLLTTAS